MDLDWYYEDDWTLFLKSVWRLLEWSSRGWRLV